MFQTDLQVSDPVVAGAIATEGTRQADQIELIASEKIVSKAVLQAQGSLLTNKYAEGYPGRRYYGGCKHVDVVETAAIERLKELFGAGFANVQPHSGAQANGAVKLALLQPGDTILDMSLDAGGHLTHGAKPALSGKWFRPVQYGFAPFREIADEVGAWLLVDMAHIAGLVAAGLHPSPVPHAHVSPPPRTRRCAGRVAASS